VAKLYSNNGMGGFIEIMSTPFAGVSNSSVAIADIDGNGTPDILISGLNQMFMPTTKLYTNNGLGGFTEVMNTPFANVELGSTSFEDIDGDGDKDVLITGRAGPQVSIAKLYINNGSGIFSEKMNTPFEGVFWSSSSFSDVDGDGDLDLLISGKTENNAITKLYKNDGLGGFTEVTEATFIGLSFGSCAFADVDSDGDKDVLITGNFSSPIAKLYTNDLINVSSEGIEPFKKVVATIFPNPLIHGNLSVNFISTKNTSLEISVYDAVGKNVLRQKNSISIGENTIPLNFVEIISGTYYVLLNDGENIISLKLLVK
jgi:hypothetical protein